VILHLSPSDAHALLAWYASVGVDEAIADMPLDYRTIGRKRKPEPENRPAPPAAVSAPSLAPATSPTSPIAAIAEARTLAEAAASLEALYTSIRAFEGCALKKTGLHTVIADGNPNAPVMVIGHAPASQEDRQGIPFCAESGQLLDKIFAAIGMTRAENLYITNMIFWRPPGKRNPTPEELAICRPFVEKHIALIQPKLLVLVGGIATIELLKPPSDKGFTKLRGHTHSYHCPILQHDITALPILDPAYLLKNPRQKALAWQDALLLQKTLESLA
jgi:uracil-DNA glycosylase